MTKISASIKGIHDTTTGFDTDVYIDNVKKTAEDGTFAVKNGVLSAIKVPIGNHILKITGDKIYDRVVGIEVRQGAENKYSVINVLDKVPEVGDYLVHLNWTGRRNHPVYGAKYEDGTIKPLDGPHYTFYIDVASFNRIPEDVRNYSLGEMRDAVKVILPDVYGSRLAGIKISQVCNPSDIPSGIYSPDLKKCDVQNIPSGDPNFWFVIAYGYTTAGVGVFTHYVSNGINHDGLTLDNIVVGGKITLSGQVGRGTINHEIVQCVGGLPLDINPSIPSVLNEINITEVQPIDRILGRSVSAMESGSRTAYDTSLFQTLTPTSVTPSLNSMYQGMQSGNLELDMSMAGQPPNISFTNPNRILQSPIRRQSEQKK